MKCSSEAVKLGRVGVCVCVCCMWIISMKQNLSSVTSDIDKMLVVYIRSNNSKRMDTNK